MPHRCTPSPTVGTYWPPIGRTTLPSPRPVASTRVKWAQSGAVGKASTFTRIRPKKLLSGAENSSTSRNAYPLPSVRTRSTWSVPRLPPCPRPGSRSTDSAPLRVSTPQSRLVPAPRGSFSKSSQNSNAGSGAQPPAGRPP
ncbi:hypothetical protein SFUMM280S_09674 [Streptomyces fumanus]